MNNNIFNDNIKSKLYFSPLVLYKMQKTNIFSYYF